MASSQPALRARLVGPDDISGVCRQIRAEAKQKIVFTNGCFDVLHAGHIATLEAAKTCVPEACVWLGLNSDDSIRRLKGSDRPVHMLPQRLRVLQALRCIDYISVFEEDTPLGLIEQIAPDILVKGGDYVPETIVGRDVVESRGGQVLIVPLEAGLSSSRVINLA